MEFAKQFQCEKYYNGRLPACYYVILNKSKCWKLVKFKHCAATVKTIRHPFGVSYRAGKMEYILSGYLPENLWEIGKVRYSECN